MHKFVRVLDLYGDNITEILPSIMLFNGEITTILLLVDGKNHAFAKAY